MNISKYERRELRAAKLEKALHGQGLYVYENNSGGDLILPKATSSGHKKVGAGQQFQGDDYFMSMVRMNELKLVKTLVTPQQESKMKMEQLEKEQEQKLLLDQPDTIKGVGKVEYVVPSDAPLNEAPTPAQPIAGATEQSDEMLINEDPIDGVEIILD